MSGCTTTIRVRYAETDQMGVVYHSNHFIWFEVGRVELLRQLGFSYRDMEAKDNCFIAVAEATGKTVLTTPDSAVRKLQRLLIPSAKVA